MIKLYYLAIVARRLLSFFITSPSAEGQYGASSSVGQSGRMMLLQGRWFESTLAPPVNKTSPIMQHEESLIQQQCVAWFRIQYPHLAPLLYHIANEGSTSKAYVGGIRKAEGLVAGVPDLMLNIPARYGKKLYHASA